MRMLRFFCSVSAPAFGGILGGAAFFALMRPAMESDDPNIRLVGYFLFLTGLCTGIIFGIQVSMGGLHTLSVSAHADVENQRTRLL